MQKEKIKRTKEQEKEIVDLIKRYGFDNVSQFAKAVGMDRQNVWARIKGRTDPDIRMILKWAKVLGCSFDLLVMYFYPDEYKDYLS